MNRHVKIAIFGSGNGTNAQRISEYFAENKDISVDCIVYDHKDAYIAVRAANLGIEASYFSKKEFNGGDTVLEYLKHRKIDYIILAGFLLLVPGNILEAYHDRIVNIHPALLPKYGGKGMYGENVHKAVIENREQESGITIHVVDSEYDHGKVLFQARCAVTPDDTPETLAQKIHQLEQRHFPEVIEQWITRCEGTDR